MATSRISRVMISADKVARSLAAHRADYPEAREVIDSLTEDLADATPGLLGGPAREAFEAAARSAPQDEVAPVPEEVVRLLADANDAMGEGGSNDGEHTALQALAEFVAGLYGMTGADT